MRDCGCDNLFRMFEGYYGPYFTPTVDAEGNLSWTNNAELPNPAPVNIRGEPGTGLQISGLVATAADLPSTAEDWTCYLVGTAVPYSVYTYNPNTGWMSLGELSSGPKGDPGAVYTPSVSTSGVITWTNDGDLPNPEAVNIKGPEGDPGDDGVSPVVTITAITGGHRITITDATHPQGQSFDVMDGTGGGGGMSATAIQLLDTILSAAVYTSDQTDNIAALIAELSGGGSEGVSIEYSGMTATISNLAGTGITYSGTTATIGGN